MKIFILAFCIFQISLALNDLDAANQQLAGQANFVINRNRQPPFIIGYGYTFYDVLLEPLSSDGLVAEIRNKAKILNDLIQLDGISLEAINALITYNIYVDVVNGMNFLLLNGNENHNYVPIQKIYPSDSYYAIARTQEKKNNLNTAFSVFREALSRLDEGVFLSFYGIPGSSRSTDFFNKFLKSIFFDLVRVVDPAASESTKSSIETLTNKFVPIIGGINHLREAKLVWEIVKFGIRSTIDSYEQFVLI